MTGEEIKEQVYDAVACDDMFYRPELRDAIYGMVDENDKLKLENAKLRELVRRYSEYTDQDRCEGCVLKRSCDDGEIDECWQIAEIREMEKELGVLDE